MVPSYGGGIGVKFGGARGAHSRRLRLPPRLCCNGNRVRLASDRRARKGRSRKRRCRGFARSGSAGMTRQASAASSSICSPTRRCSEPRRSRWCVWPLRRMLGIKPPPGLFPKRPQKGRGTLGATSGGTEAVDAARPEAEAASAAAPSEHDELRRSSSERALARRTRPYQGTAISFRVVNGWLRLRLTDALARAGRQLTSPLRAKRGDPGRSGGPRRPTSRHTPSTKKPAASRRLFWCQPYQLRRKM